MTGDAYRPGLVGAEAPEPHAGLGPAGDIPIALKTCPFCGGDAQRITLDEPGDNFGGDVICCTRCQASSHVEFGRKENLVSRWNARHGTGEIERLREALQRIVDWKPDEFHFPADWQEQIDGCAECQSYVGHPIQRGICNTHRQPIWDREKHDRFQIERRGSAMWLIAHDALAASGIEARSDETAQQAQPEARARPDAQS